MQNNKKQTRLFLLVTGAQQNYLSVELANLEAPFNTLLPLVTCSGFKMVLTSSQVPNQKRFTQPRSSKLITGGFCWQELVFSAYSPQC